MAVYRAADLDALHWQGPVVDKDLTSPPGTSAKGDRYIIGTPATGGWAGHDLEVTYYTGSAWVFIAKEEGQVAWVKDENLFYHFNGTAWVVLLTSAHASTHQPGGSDATVVDAPGTKLGLWSWRKHILLPIPDANLTDFPNCIKIIANAHIGARCLANGYDIRFTADDGVTELPYEREVFSGGGGAPLTAIIWVKSNVSTAGTYVYIYFGNSAAADGENATAVWDAAAKAVYHMKDLTTSTIKDSTANANNGTKLAANEPIEATGKIGKGQDFDGVNDTILSAPVVIGLTQTTLEAWVKLDSIPGIREPLVVGNSGAGCWRIDVLPDGALEANFWADGNATSAPGLISTGIWYHVCVTFNGTTKLGYLNGAQVATATSGATAINASVAMIGCFPDWGRYLDGLIDEVRISSVARSAAWIKFEYANMAAADGGLTWGAAEYLTTAHATTHKSGGADAIKLDELAAADDNANLNVSAAAHGLMSKLPNDPLKLYTGDGTWAVLAAAAGLIHVYSVAAATARNSNPAQKSTVSSSYVKLKETALGEPTRGVRIKFTLWTSNASYAAYGQIYRNGVAIGTERSSTDLSGEVFSEDFNVGWSANDLLQVYVHRSGTATAYVSTLEFCYDRAIASFGSWHLASYLPTVEQTAYSMTNQDP